ncbi:MAG TPA: FAD-dependent oxidoreductase [Steroidobacteraceae bacterium]|nr:FAD-dependent oxidoreductase [Steroidobacteraceae bacterium]
MSKLKRVLIVGGGVGGMSAAIQIRKLGLDVTLAEIDPAWKIYGAGITITGPTLRALNTLGILPEMREHGCVWPNLKLYSQDGKLIEKIVFPELEPGLAGGGGIMRPVLHKILSTHTVKGGTDVRLGVSVEQLAQGPDAVQVKFTDGRQDSFDLVVGADGIFSKIRERVFPDAPRPKFTGQGCWRLVADRPADMEGSVMYIGYESKLGFTPISPTQMYMFLLQKTPANPWVEAKDQPQRLYDLMADWGGYVPEVRRHVLDSSTINYRPLEAVLLPAPWHRGRVVLLGDAAHATTPHLASGAGMAVEDALVLAQEIERGGAVEELLTRYNQRRFERGRLVVENSLKLGELEMNHGSATEHAHIMEATMAVLGQPI